MGGFSPSISPENLYGRLGCAAAPLIIAVRRAEAFARDRAVMIDDALHAWCRSEARDGR
jgi:hypothetical protein